MLLVESLRRSQCRSLFIVFGAQSVKCGIKVNNNFQEPWLKDSLIDLPIESCADIDLSTKSLILVIDHLKEILKEGIGESGGLISRITVLVSDFWLVFGEVPWGSHLHNRASAISYARNHLSNMGFELNVDDVIRLDDSSYGMPRLVVAYPAELLAALSQLAFDLGARLSSVLPLGVAAWYLAKQQIGDQLYVSVVLDENVMSLAYGNNLKQLNFSDILVRNDIEGNNELWPSIYAAWKRMSARHPYLSEVKTLPVLDLHSEPRELSIGNDRLLYIKLPERNYKQKVFPSLQLAEFSDSLFLEIDAISRRQNVSATKLVLCVVIALASLVIVCHSIFLNTRIKSLTNQLQIAQSAKLPVKKKLWNREELAKAKAVNSAIRDLNFPIVEILRDLQPTDDDQVAILSFETSNLISDEGGVNIKIMAEALNGDEMARYLRLLGERKRFSISYLIRHEVDGEKSGSNTHINSYNQHISGYEKGDKYLLDRPLRFIVEAIWNE